MYENVKKFRIYTIVLAGYKYWELIVRLLIMQASEFCRFWKGY